ncbi:hypothetical protein SUGI_0674880 [Cryptomeria japonica]|nr:hypothetical protein SUGI_0674880 [Cryptomeria japonica]
MERTVVIKLAAIVILVFYQVESSQGKCEYPAIFNFGDSNSDTYGFYSTFSSESPPYGMTFFHKPSGQASDECLVVKIGIK